jgi:hypothetical protein
LCQDQRVADKSVADQLRKLGVKNVNVLVQMAERGQLLALKCEMPQCYHHKGRGEFDPVGTPGNKWTPSRDHYPILKSAGGKLVPENVRLSHTWCNNRDYGWRTQIRTLLAKGKSLAEIAETLNRKDVPPAHGTNRWTAAMVRKAYVSQSGFGAGCRFARAWAASRDSRPPPLDAGHASCDGSLVSLSGCPRRR